MQNTETNSNSKIRSKKLFFRLKFNKNTKAKTIATNTMTRNYANLLNRLIE